MPTNAPLFCLTRTSRANPFYGVGAISARRVYLWRARRTYAPAAYRHIATQPTGRYVVRRIWSRG